MLALAAVVGLGAATVLVVESTMTDSAPDLTATTAIVDRSWPASFVLVVLLGFITAQVVAVRLALLSPSRARIVVLVVIWLGGVVALLIAERMLGLMRGIYEAAPSGTEALRLSLVIVALVATVAAAAFALLGRWRPAAVATCVPLIALATAWAVCAVTGSSFTESTDYRFGAELPLSAPIGLGVVLIAMSLAGAGLAITLWQVALGVRAIADGATATTATYGHALRQLRQARPRANVGAWTMLAAIVAVKLAWIALGLAGALPSWLGGNLRVWHTIRQEGWLSYGLAAAVSVVAVVWLARGTRGPAERGGMLWALAAIVVGLALPELVFQALAVSYSQGAGEWALDGARWVEFVQPWAPVVVILCAGLAGGRWWLAGRRDAGTFLLLAFGLWGLPRLPALIADLIRYPWYPWGLSMPTESTYGTHAGWVNLVTVDLAITVVVLVLGIAAATGRRTVGLVPVLLVIVATTTVVYLGLLVGAAVSGAVGNALAFVLPFGYVYLFAAGGFNRRVPEREGRLLGAVALSIVALTVGVVRGHFGDPVGQQDLDLAGELLVMPVLITLVVSTLASRARRPVIHSEAAAIPRVGRPGHRGTHHHRR